MSVTAPGLHLTSTTTQVQTQSTSAPKNSASIITTSGPANQDSVPKTVSPELKAIETLAQEQLGEFLDVKVKPDGTLVITANDKKFGFWDDAHSERSMGQIREKLGLEDGIIGKHNPEVYDRYSSDVQRGYGSTPDDGILASGSSIIIPASEVGKNPHIFQILFGTFDDLKK